MRCLDQASLIGAARFCGGDGQWPQEGTESRQPAGGGNHRDSRSPKATSRSVKSER